MDDIRTVGEHIVAPCGFKVIRTRKTAMASMKSHMRFCEKCSGPAIVKKSRTDLLARFGKKGSERPVERPTKAVESISPLGKVETPIPTSKGLPLDMSAFNQAFGENGSVPPMDTAPPGGAVPPGGAPIPERKVGEFMGVPIDGTGLSFSGDEWLEIALQIHDMESALAVVATSIEECEMPEKTKMFLSRLLSKILQAIWGALDLSKAFKILLTLYVVGQVAYCSTVILAVKNVKDKEKKEKKKERRTVKKEKDDDE